MTSNPSPIAVPPTAAASRELADIIARFSPIDGEHRTAIPALSFYRYSMPTMPECGVAKAALILAAQGAKRITAGGTTCEYDRTRCVISSVDLPAVSQVTMASPDKPYLCLVLALDLQCVADVIARIPARAEPAASSGTAMTMASVRPDLLDAALRLARLLETPRDVAVLAPLLEQEIVYRLLLAGHGARLRQLATAGSRFNRIARAVDWLRPHYAEPLRVEELAQHTKMSVSSLHHHFKGGDVAQSVAVPEAVAPARGAASAGRARLRCGLGGAKRRLRKRVAVQSRVPPDVRRAAVGRPDATRCP